MKKNFKNNIAQKGGLMIEALAMLGLIAVVTPTMYKKSAERTLEVEDINTADTIRSYMGATEAYMAANYRGIIKEMTENEDGTPKENPETIKAVTWNDIQSYMPYGFKNDKALYDYNTPKIALVRQGTNLSAFALFPAKSAGGLGQERTSRIASLIGANGGYTKADKSAHGIGGVWNLSSDDVKDVFGSNNNNEFSLVTASSNVINSTSGAGQVENTKYLQRTAENDGELWRNAMRTDLYMGGGDPDADPDDSEHVGNHNILNINSLIVGAEKDMAHLGDEESTANNGLYLNPDGDNPNAYIGGTLTAAKDQLFANENKFAFGTPTNVVDEGNNVVGTNYRFEADKHGNITNYGDLDMGKGLSENGSSGHMYLGSLNNEGRKVNNVDATNFMTADASADGASLSLLSPDMLHMTTDEAEIDAEVNKVGGTHLMIEKTGFKGADNEEGKDSKGNDINPSYTQEQTFPVVIGSNAMVKGVLSAGQMDAQHLRTATLSTGSEHIDDEYKWMKVDKDGVVLQDIGTTTTGSPENPSTERNDSTYVNVSSDGVLMRTGSTDDAASINLNKRVDGNDTFGDITLAANNEESAITAKNSVVSMQIKGENLKIGNPDDDNEVLIYDESVNINDNPYRVVVGQGGNVDVVGSNFKVMDMYNQNILTIKGNNLTESGDNKFNDFTSYSGDIDYDITAHGNVLFSSKSGTTASEISSYDSDDTFHYMAIGANNAKAGVNIVESENDDNVLTDNEQRVVFVDLSAHNKESNTYVDGSGNDASALNLTNDKIADGGENDIVDTYKKNDAGTMKAGMVYVRRGLVDIVPDRGDVASTGDNGVIANRTDNSANDGSGIIRASRLVANNINTSGNEERVPDMLDENLMKQFNGDNVVRYDTYMVNPAYTSVMKDIKLTTRGGARLSDVLPDFIAKGIYLANNTYDDALSRMQFILQSDSFEIDADAMGVPSSHIDSTTHGLAETAVHTGSSGSGKYSTNNWASPFSGLVPAPQCPPGYGRVITLTPFRYEMAQAGKLALSADSGYSDGVGNASGYYVNTLEMGSRLKRASYSHSKKEDLQNELEAAMPKARKVKIHGNIRVTASGGLQADGKPVTGSDTFSISDDSTAEVYSNILKYTTNTTTGNHGDGSDFGSTDTTEQSPYVLTVGEVKNPSTGAKTSGLSPLIFQQSTWLHTEAVPVVNNGDEPSVGGKKGTYAGYSPDKYIRGWAVLQGFLYHQSEYANFACEIDSEQCKQYVPKGVNDNYEIIWNLFPVAKNSLGSYATTYCYFDRLSLTDYAHPYWKSSSNDFEKFDILNEVPISYEKGRTTQGGDTDYEKARKRFYDQLNDPTMKYNEVW